MKRRAQTLKQRRRLRAIAIAAEQEAEAAADRAKKAAPGNRNALQRAAVLARAKAMKLWGAVR